jgi:hypothetical protein
VIKQFEVGLRVALRSVGLGTITDYAARAADGRPRPCAAGEEPAFYVVASATRVTCVPIATAHELIRLLVSSETASDMMQRLRAGAIAAGEGLASMTTPRAMAVMADGDPAAHADFLRELYALETIDHRQGMAILTFEDMVLDEVAEVLGADRAALEAEMRERYPAFARRVAANRAGMTTDGPEVVAAPVRPLPGGIKTK